MIELRTGVPGSGKTLSMVEALSKLLASWGSKPEEGRPIFVHNIKDLALAHAPLPVKEVSFGNRTQLVPDWEAVPDGSLVIIDECQDLLPPRSSQTAAPAHIAWFNTHRHRGIDIWITTQHPKLIDFSVRALVGKHMHFRRLFGGQRACVYEWDGCSDNLGGMKDAVMTYYSFPKKAYQFYKSAEVHTKQRFKLPRWLVIPLAGIALGVYAVPRAYTTLSDATSGKGLNQAAHAASAPATPGSGAIAPTPRAVPSGAAAAASAPVVAASAAKKLAGCIVYRGRCECFEDSGTRLELPRDACEDGATRLGAIEISKGGGGRSAPAVSAAEAKRSEDRYNDATGGLQW
jgi:zona occludens toxin